MRAGIAALVLAYVLSQFYRSFLAVLTKILEADLGAGALDLSRASGAWYPCPCSSPLPGGSTWALP